VPARPTAKKESADIRSSSTRHDPSFSINNSIRKFRRD
jgi:hypothetical protein